MPSIELNILVVAALAILPGVIIWMMQVGRIKLLKSKILDHEFEMVKTDSHVLELEKEVSRLKKEHKPNQTAGVIAISEKSGKTATG
jgi:hypothetical protein